MEHLYHFFLKACRFLHPLKLYCKMKARKEIFFFLLDFSFNENEVSWFLEDLKKNLKVKKTCGLK